MTLCVDHKYEDSSNRVTAIAENANLRKTQADLLALLGSYMEKRDIEGVISIHETDAGGFQSRRDIIFIELITELTTEKGFQYLKAVCHNQNGIHTFRVDRIDEP